MFKYFYVEQESFVKIKIFGKNFDKNNAIFNSNRFIFIYNQYW